MLNQQQFFDTSQLAVDPTKMNFSQFTHSAPYFHGSYNSNTWAHDWPHTHAGTLQAANDRLSDWGQGHIFPLQHPGPMSAKVISDDEANAMEYDYPKPKESFQYRNDAEDTGSLSVVGPSKNFRTYHQYVDSLSAPTEQQLAERKGREHFDFVAPHGRSVRGQMNWDMGSYGDAQR